MSVRWHGGRASRSVRLHRRLLLGIGAETRAYMGNLIRVLLIRREIVFYRPLRLKVQGFAKLSEVLNQEMQVHLLTMFLG